MEPTSLPRGLLFLQVLIIALLLALTLGCAVVVRSEPGYTWWYYPDYDVYYSPTIDAWAYWTGENWLVVQTQPRWLEITPRTRVIRIRYRGPRPWTEWHTHRRWS